jgi:hypothetical protein
MEHYQAKYFPFLLAHPKCYKIIEELIMIILRVNRDSVWACIGKDAALPSITSDSTKTMINC